MADSFIQRLRMNNIFGGNPPLGMPDFGGMVGGGGSSDFGSILENAAAMRHEREKELLNLRANISAGNFMTPSGQLQSTIANRVAAPISQQEYPMNVLFNPGISEYQRGRLGIDRAKLNQTGDIARAKLTDVDENRAIAQQRANVYDRMHDLTDEEKQNILDARMSRGITERGAVASQQIKQRGDITSGQIEQRGDIGSRQIGERGTQALQSIAARTAGQMQRDAAKPVKEELPTQTTARQKNQAREFADRNPELGKFITFDDNGHPTVKQPSTSWYGGVSGPTAEQYKKIQDAIYGTAPVATKPPAKLAGKSSKYNVTIE